MENVERFLNISPDQEQKKSNGENKFGIKGKDFNIHRAVQKPEREGESPELKYAHGEHLKEGIKPIMAGIGTPEQFEKYPGKEKEIEDAYYDYKGRKNRIRNVDYFGDPGDLKKQGFKNTTTSGNYVISPVESLDKISKNFSICTGVIAAGQDRETGENISFISHESSFFFLSSEENKNKFRNDLRQQLEELKERSADRTIDVAIFGGYYPKQDVSSKKDYIASIGLLSEEVKQSLNFEPLVITGPKTGGRHDVYYDNENRRLYIMMWPAVDESTIQSFYPSKLEGRMEEWDKEV